MSCPAAQNAIMGADAAGESRDARICRDTIGFAPVFEMAAMSSYFSPPRPRCETGPKYGAPSTTSC
eukprot:3802046-Pyramimonas_sp.AAC.2